MTASRLTLVVVGCAAAACAGGEPSGSVHGFDVMEKSIRELGVALDDGSVTSVDLVDFHLARIDAYDARGPALNAVITVNPNARARAAALDAERTAGTVRGPLHGIPVVVKDNYDTADMPTTAGTLGLATSVPPGRCVPGAPAARGGRHHPGEDQHARARPGDHHGRVARWPDPQPLRSGTQSGRLQRGHGRRDRGKLRDRRHGQRHVRLDPHPVGASCLGRAPRDAWSGQRRRHRSAVDDPGHRRPACAVGRRSCPSCSMRPSGSIPPMRRRD